MSDQAQSVPEVSEPENPPQATPETPSQSTQTTERTTPPEPGSLLSEEPPAPFDAEKLTMPEGLSKDDGLWGDFTNLATKHKLPMALAEELVGLAAKQVQAVSQKQMALWDKQNEDWQAEVRADKEIGGDKLAGTLQIFSKVASDPELSDPGFREALAFTGAGNHPAIVRTLARWARALSEGGPVQGTPVATSRAPQTLGEAIYGPNGPHSGGPRLS